MLNRILKGLSPALLAGALVALAMNVGASIPGNVDERSYEGLLHVCVDKEPGHQDYIVCDEQVGGFIDAPYTGSECAAEGLPAVCTIDFIPRAKAVGPLTLIADDPIPASGENPRTTILFKFRAGGVRHLVSDTFDTDKLGNWNSLGIDGGEIVALGNISTQDTSETEFQYAQGNLTDFADEVLRIVDAAKPQVDLSNAVAVFTEAEHRPDRLESNHQFDDLATVGKHQLRIEFARVRP